MHEIQLWKHQEEIIRRAENSNHYALFAEMGCLARDSVVSINTGGKAIKLTIEELYRKYNLRELAENEKGFSNPVRVRSVKGDRIGLNNILAVYRSGEKEVFRLRVKGQKPLKLTADHKIYTRRGWVEASALELGDTVACENTKNLGSIAWRSFESLEPVGLEMTYDIAAEPPFNSFVANGMVVHNTGKTCTAIQILRKWCAREKRPLRTLVLCPPTVRNVWAREVEKFSRLGKYVTVLEGPGKKRAKVFQEKAFGDDFSSGINSLPGIFVTNYESLLMKELFELIKAWLPDVLILDESHMVKAITSKRTKKCIELGDMTPRKLLLTGTPILNTAMDIWAQFRVLDGGSTFDKNFYAFRARYFYDKNASMPSHVKFPDWRPMPGIEDEFNRLIYQKATRVLKKDCLDLPPLVRQRVEVELSPEQARMYREMRDEYVAYMGDKACVASIALTKGLRLQQMVSGFWVDEEGERCRSFSSNPRLAALKELLGSIHGKVIVWTTFRHSYGPIEAACGELGLGWVSLYGGMTDKARQKSIDRFQEDDEVRVMVANPAAGGTGVTLTRASYMIYYSRGFSLEHDLQSEARAHRGGSEIHDKITRIDLVAAGTIDEVILAALERKENLSKTILNIGEML